jgi:hypothetical protein
MKSGNLNFLEPSGPLQAWKGTALPLPYSFMLEAESTPVPQCGQKECVNEKCEWQHRESNPASTNCATGRPPTRLKVQLIILRARSSLENWTKNKCNGRRWEDEDSRLRDSTSWGRQQRQRSYRPTISAVEVFFPRIVATTRWRTNEEVMKHLQGHSVHDTHSDVIEKELYLIFLSFFSLLVSLPSLNPFP